MYYQTIKVISEFPGIILTPIFFISPLSKKNCWMIKISKLRGREQERGVNGTSLLMKSFFKALSPIWFLKLLKTFAPATARRQKKTIATLSSTLNLISQCASCIKFNGLMYFLVLGTYISYCHSGLFLFYVYYLYYIKIVMFTLSTFYFFTLLKRIANAVSMLFL